MINDENDGQIQYYGHKVKIELKFLSQEELRKNKDRPSLLQTEWEEIYRNEKTGRYIMVSQGAVVYQFIYLRYNDMKIFTFEHDPDEW